MIALKQHLLEHTIISLISKGEPIEVDGVEFSFVNLELRVSIDEYGADSGMSRNEFFERLADAKLIECYGLVTGQAFTYTPEHGISWKDY